jgi:hypothetical protein
MAHTMCFVWWNVNPQHKLVTRTSPALKRYNVAATQYMRKMLRITKGIRG